MDREELIHRKKEILRKIASEERVYPTDASDGVRGPKDSPRPPTAGEVQKAIMHDTNIGIGVAHAVRGGRQMMGGDMHGMNKIGEILHKVSKFTATIGLNTILDGRDPITYSLYGSPSYIVSVVRQYLDAWITLKPSTRELAIKAVHDLHNHQHMYRQAHAQLLVDGPSPDARQNDHMISFPTETMTARELFGYLLPTLLLTGFGFGVGNLWGGGGGPGALPNGQLAIGNAAMGMVAAAPNLANGGLNLFDAAWDFFAGFAPVYAMGMIGVTGALLDKEGQLNRGLKQAKAWHPIKDNTDPVDMETTQADEEEEVEIERVTPAQRAEREAQETAQFIQDYGEF